MNFNLAQLRWVALPAVTVLGGLAAAAGLDERGLDVLRLAVPVVIVAVAVGMWLRERALSGPLRRIAHANGWTFRRSASRLPARWRGAPFDGGTERKMKSVIHGTVDGRGFTAFNLDVITSTGRSSSTDYYSVVALDLTVNLPAVEVRATLGGLEQAMGLSRIEVEHEGFNRRYRVSAADRKLASDVLSPRTIETILAGRIVNLRIGGGSVVAWAVGRLEVHEVLGWSRALVSVVDRVPDFVWKDHSPRPAGPGLTWSPGASSLGPMPSPSQEPS